MKEQSEFQLNVANGSKVNSPQFSKRIMERFIEDLHPVQITTNVN